MSLSNRFNRLRSLRDLEVDDLRRYRQYRYMLTPAHLLPRPSPFHVFVYNVLHLPNLFLAILLTLLKIIYYLFMTLLQVCRLTNLLNPFAPVNLFIRAWRMAVSRPDLTIPEIAARLRSPATRTPNVALDLRLHQVLAYRPPITRCHTTMDGAAA
jgi:hypothetical protein